MINRRVLLTGASALLGQAAFLSAQTQRGRKVVFEHDLPDLSLSNWAVTVVEVSYGPGDTSSAHRHPGITIVCVLEGEVRSKVGDDPERTYHAGEVFIETPTQLHGVSANASPTRPAKLLVTFLAEKGKQLTRPA